MLKNASAIVVGGALFFSLALQQPAQAQVSIPIPGTGIRVELNSGNSGSYYNDGYYNNSGDPYRPYNGYNGQYYEPNSYEPNTYHYYNNSYPRYDDYNRDGYNSAGYDRRGYNRYGNYDPNYDTRRYRDGVQIRF